MIAHNDELSCATNAISLVNAPSNYDSISLPVPISPNDSSNDMLGSDQFIKTFNNLRELFRVRFSYLLADPFCR